MSENIIFLGVDEAAKALGVSRYFIRQGCKAGTVPHIQSGKKYLINIPLTMEMLNQASRENANGNA